MIQTAMLCGHKFDTEQFQNYPDDYAGYCPECVKALEESDDNFVDVDTEPDGNGIPMFDGDSFSEDDDEDYDEDVALDDYEEQENIEDDDIDPMAEETEEDHERDLQKAAMEVVDSLDSIYIGDKTSENVPVDGIKLEFDPPMSGISQPMQKTINMVLRKGRQVDPATDYSNGITLEGFFDI